MTEDIRRIHPAGKINAAIQVPPSKSYTNRAMIVAALAEGDSKLIHPSLSDDSKFLMNGLKEFGVDIRRRGEIVDVTGTGGSIHVPKNEIFVGNAGTAMRFLSTFACLANGTTVLNGDGQMQQRPIGDLLAALRTAGIKSACNNGFPPVTIYGGNFSGGRIGINATISSQYASSILLCAPYARRQVILHIKGGISSLPYIDMSLHVMRSFGAEVEVIDLHNYHVSNSQKYVGREFTVEADATSATYFFAAAALSQGRVHVSNLSSDSLQGDLKFLNVLSDMGCTITKEENGIEVHGSKLLGIEVDMNSMPDCVPTLAVVAAFAEGSTRISNVAHLQYKETNRLKALAIELKKIGAGVELLEDGLIIHPRQLQGAEIETYNDHRIAMSFAIAGLKVDGISIKNPSCVSKSFPNFWKEFEKLEQGI